MNFIEYSNLFQIEANKKNYDADYISRCLKYASNLHEKSLPIIYDQKHLSLLLGIHPLYLYGVVNSPNNYYRSFKIKKKNSKYRKIHEPLPILKEIQHWIKKEILDKLEPSIYTKAFKKNSSIRDNAKFHKKQSKVLCVDIKNYFDSIHTYNVYNLFLSFGYTKGVSMMLTKLCMLKDCLPQGSPTSPVISNLVTISMDESLYKLCYSYDPPLRYSRYADDITFSGNFINDKIIHEISVLINKYGFTLNRNKTRIVSSNKRQLVTGIVVNKKMQVSKDTRNEVRKVMFFINKFGLDDHLKKISWKKTKLSYLRRLLGTINFILFVNPKDTQTQIYKHTVMELLDNCK